MAQKSRFETILYMKQELYKTWILIKRDYNITPNKVKPTVI